MSQDFLEQPDKESQERAEELSQRLLSNVSEGRASGQGIDEGFPINDVTMNLDRFSVLRRFCLDAGLLFPCAAIGEEAAIPLDFSGVPTGGLGAEAAFPLMYNLRWWDVARYFGMRHWDFERYFQEWLPASYQVSLVDHERVLNSVKRLVSSFLAHRIWGIFGRTPATNPPIGHLVISVTTQNPGISVEFSPAYFVTWNFFAGPTSPLTPPPAPTVCGAIRPGKYLFGGYGPLVPKGCEPTIFNVPPTLQIPLTVV